MFDIQDRNRYYGLKVGDIVTVSGLEGQHEVVRYGVSDNNRVIVKSVKVDSVEYRAVAEHCTVITKVDDIGTF